MPMNVTLGGLNTENQGFRISMATQVPLSQWLRVSGSHNLEEHRAKAAGKHAKLYWVEKQLSVKEKA